MNSKRGILGGVIATFVATVVILIIILVFILGSGVIKKFTGSDEGIQVYNEADVGIADIFNYLPEYLGLAKVRVLVGLGKTYEDARGEAGYGG